MPGMFGSATGAGAAMGGPVGAGIGAAVDIGGKILGAFMNRGAAKREAENARLSQQFQVDTRNKSRKRKLSTVSSLMKKLAEHPEVYGKYFSPDMFGALPGPLTADDLLDPNAPKYKAQSGLSALLQGAVGGVTDYLGNRDAADRDVAGRILVGAGQPTRG